MSVLKLGRQEVETKTTDISFEKYFQKGDREMWQELEEGLGSGEVRRTSKL